MNQVNLIGNLSQEIELKYLPSGIAIAESSIAVNKRVKKQDGTIKDKVMFIEFLIFGKGGETVNQYLKKGDKVRLTGSLDLQQWVSKDGTKKSKHVIVVEEFEFLNQKPKESVNTTSDKPVAPDTDDIPPEDQI